MKFKYKKIGPGVFRPIIPIEICAGEQCVRYEVLIDSGADINLFDAEIGEAIGMNVGAGEQQIVEGLGGKPLIYFKHSVVIRVGGHAFPVEAGFLPRPPQDGLGIVGQKGFFDIFVVQFDLLKKQIKLTMRDFKGKTR